MQEIRDSKNKPHPAQVMTTQAVHAYCRGHATRGFSKGIRDRAVKAMDPISTEVGDDNSAIPATRDLPNTKIKDSLNPAGVL